MTSTAGPGRRVTIIDVARRAGVSKSLASLVIRNAPGASAASREAVLLAVAELGYQPDLAAKALREQRSRLLGVVLDPGDPFHADLLEAIHPAAEERGFDVVLGARLPGRGEKRAVDSLLRSRCEGLILLGSESSATALRQLAERVPVTLISRSGRGTGTGAVLGADEKGAALATDHLLGLGHRRIRFVDGGRRPGAVPRRRGYLAAMRRAGAEPDVVPGDHTEESGIRAAQQLLGELRDGDAHPVTAVFGGNDRCATGVLDTLLRAGVDVPQRVSVVGYDDSRLARMAHVDLTTVAQDAPELARRAVGSLVGRVEDGTPPGPDVLLEPALVVRGTTGPPPG
ncbi:LacI family DNA-binding transcriptional regulator [Nakamurella alba]|uniref:LacI family DNA-binding transcriptional regulator n=1 Tax=Nakamurella alba TaxID=2665158 RepID=UPI002AC3615D|nr:LacI family DNA-binding transcriptional regulator [Nakamurella alba]